MQHRLAIWQQLLQLESWACLQNQGWQVEALQEYLEKRLQVWLVEGLLACQAAWRQVLLEGVLLACLVLRENQE